MLADPAAGEHAAQAGAGRRGYRVAGGVPVGAEDGLRRAVQQVHPVPEQRERTVGPGHAEQAGQGFGRAGGDQLGELPVGGQPRVKGSRVPPVSSTQMALVWVYSCTASMPFSRPSPDRPKPPKGTSGPTTR